MGHSGSDKILLITVKQVIGLKFNGFRVGSFFAINVVWPVVSHSEKSQVEMR